MTVNSFQCYILGHNKGSTTAMTDKVLNEPKVYSLTKRLRADICLCKSRLSIGSEDRPSKWNVARAIQIRPDRREPVAIRSVVGVRRQSAIG